MGNKIRYGSVHLYPIITALRRLREKNCIFKASLRYISRLSQKRRRNWLVGGEERGKRWEEEGKGWERDKG